MNRIIECFRLALPASWKSTKWLLKLMIPISLAVTLMQHFGILAWIATWINPLFVHFGLPGESAVVFISGATAGTYAGIAAMMSIPQTMKQALLDIAKEFNCNVEFQHQEQLDTKVHFVANRSDGINCVVEGLNMMNIINVEYKGNKLVVF